MGIRILKWGAVTTAWITAAMAALATGTSAQVELPLSSENGWFVVDVTVNGEVGRFVLDTGAGATAVTESGSRRFGLPRGSSMTVVGASGPQEVGSTTIERLEWGPRRMSGIRALLLPDEAVTPDADPAIPYDGVLGVGVFAAYDLILDPINRRLILLDDGDALPDDLDRRLAPPVRARRPSGLLGVDVTVNGVTMPAVVDTGSRQVILSEDGADVAGVELGEADERRSRGIGTARIDAWRRSYQVSVGETDFPPLDGLVSDLPVFGVLGYRKDVLLLGTPVLRSCVMHISYVRSEVRMCARPGA